MKRTLLLLLFGLLVSLSNYTAWGQTNADYDIGVKDVLKGKVKQLKQQYYDASLEHGKIIQNKENNGYYSNYLKKYNDGGKHIETIYFNGKGGLCLELSHKGNLIGKTLLDYDDKGNLIEERLYNAKEHLTKKNNCIYDDKGNRIGINYYDTSGTLINKSTFQYDDKGNIIEEKYYKGNDILDYICTFKYDDKGNQIEKNDSYQDTKFKITHKRTYKYDKKGNMIECKICDGNGNIFKTYTYKYDVKGNRIEWDYIGSDNEVKGIYTYTYEYDKEGNWIKQTTDEFDKYAFGKKHLYNVTTREIEYY
jgi:hypothetical protein